MDDGTSVRSLIKKVENINMVQLNIEQQQKISIGLIFTPTPRTQLNNRNQNEYMKRMR